MFGICIRPELSSKAQPWEENNLEKSGEKICQKPFFPPKNQEFLKIFLLFVEEKSAILLVLPIEEISLWPELSSPPRFRFQGGYPERDGQTEDGPKSLCLK